MSVLLAIVGDVVAAERVRHLMMDMLGPLELGGDLECREALNNYRSQLRQKVSQL